MQSFRLSALLLVLVAVGRPAAAQLPSEGEWRFGIRLGGTGFFGVTAEYFWDDERSVEGAVGTFSFRNLTLAATAHQYLGSDSFRPVLGAGLWAAGGVTEEGVPLVLLLRAPVGFDWQADDEHFLSFTVAATRGVLIRRPDPDHRPLSGGWLPVPALTYRHLSR